MTAREAVKLAAKLAPSAKEWLTRDENGVWEKQARELLALGKERAPVSMPDSEIGEQVANVIALRAVEALLREQR